MHHTLVAQPGRYPYQAPTLNTSSRPYLNQAATAHTSSRLYPVALSCPNILVLHLQARVERIAQAVTEEVKRQHREENRYPREETDPRVDFQDHQTGFQVPAPARRGGLCPESQEAQGGFGDDRRPHAQRRRDDDG